MDLSSYFVLQIFQVLRPIDVDFLLDIPKDSCQEHLGPVICESRSVGDDVIAKHSLQHIQDLIACGVSCSILLKPQLVTITQMNNNKS